MPEMFAPNGHAGGSRLPQTWLKMLNFQICHFFQQPVPQCIAPPFPKRPPFIPPDAPYSISAAVLKCSWYNIALYAQGIPNQNVSPFL